MLRTYPSSLSDGASNDSQWARLHTGAFSKAPLGKLTLVQPETIPERYPAPTARGWERNNTPGSGPHGPELMGSTEEEAGTHGHLRSRPGERTGGQGVSVPKVKVQALPLRVPPPPVPLPCCRVPWASVLGRSVWAALCESEMPSEACRRPLPAGPTHRSRGFPWPLSASGSLSRHRPWRAGAGGFCLPWFPPLQSKVRAIMRCA